MDIGVRFLLRVTFYSSQWRRSALKKIARSRYAILRELTDAALEEAVTTYMNDGWKPVGGLVISYNEDLEHKEYIQPMSN